MTIEVRRRSNSREDRGGDPLDGLVNLFDLGIVLAVAFMLAALSSLKVDASGRPVRSETQTRPKDAVVVQKDQRVEPGTATGGRVVGRGKAVGRVYELSDGRTVVVRDR
ncbi:DUF2149 domain-containing protein [Patulibacter sp. S7RM1-6]